MAQVTRLKEREREQRKHEKAKLTPRDLTKKSLLGRVRWARCLPISETSCSEDSSMERERLRVCELWREGMIFSREDPALARASKTKLTMPKWNSKPKYIKEEGQEAFFHHFGVILNLIFSKWNSFFYHVWPTFDSYLIIFHNLSEYNRIIFTYQISKKWFKITSQNKIKNNCLKGTNLTRSRNIKE